MRLYHYRPISSALLEIGNGSFHFASHDELNDPIEGYVHVYWQGDRAAWEGLFRNYVCSLYQAIELYLLAADEDMIRHNTLIIDLNAFDEVPLGKILKALGDSFIESEVIQRISSLYGEGLLKVGREELETILYYIHNSALLLCIQTYASHDLIPKEEADRLLSEFKSREGAMLEAKQPLETLVDMNRAKDELFDDKQRAVMAKILGEVLEEMLEIQYLKMGFEDETFLYGNKQGVQEVKEVHGKKIRREAATTARQRRNWLSVSIDFPKIYVAELREMIYPESYVTCFSSKNDDSAMWGNYADYHRGVCLIYEAEDDVFRLMAEGISRNLKAQPVCYEGELIMRNFFETFGRLTYKQITTWLTGRNGVSSALKVFDNESEWRDRYWEAYTAKNYRKLKAWEHESEYRLVINNMFYRFDDPESRNLKFEPKILKGVIFGINTSEYDKKCMMEKLLERKDEWNDVIFYQAKYNDEKQKIEIRKKSLWKLK